MAWAGTAVEREAAAGEEMHRTREEFGDRSCNLGPTCSRARLQQRALLFLDTMTESYLVTY